ncbi:paraquat-inducible protein A [Palleronia marisminoris]|uniref:Inner membrane protein YebS n=1 Tax=Palleronia marisminoris TaxID=315423 RepID=A0A1Y5RS49_9RHOB|nr:paraquat-inducible protein A [Palleronia marisminoris]SFG52841.1 paraquat-inducible protein A [Palleronia marisminoris]SLN23866.1 Inner membrane protein YebS [Palleronia marisminoris]
MDGTDADVPAGVPLDELIACPQCDALYHARLPEDGTRAVCHRCHGVLISPRRDAFLRVVAFAVTVVVLMAGAIFFPFLGVNVAGFSNRASVVDTALAFLDGGWMTGLSVFVVFFIIMIPALRAILVIYTLAPLLVGRAPLRGARKAFRWAEDMRPWSMAEIFIIGCAVALVKVADLARVEFGPAFFMFGALVIVTVLLDGSLDRWSIWKALDRTS